MEWAERTAVLLLAPSEGDQSRVRRRRHNAGLIAIRKSFPNGKKRGAFHGADRLTSHPLSPLALALLQTIGQGTAG